MTTLAKGNTPTIAIMGSGVSGLCLAMQLRRAGIDSFTIYEKAGDLGGTWRDNTYPGCACDVPSHFYSFSFETKSDWSRVYPPQEEIHAYLRSCAEKYGLFPKIRFNTEISCARFDEGAGEWRLTTAQGEEVTANILVSGLGQLNRPKIPEFKGAGDFAGEVFHTARWRDDVPLEGKKVAIIGNGPSAAQVIPEVAKVAGALTVFQRSPCHVVPRMDEAYSERAKKIFALPGMTAAYRTLLYWMFERNFIFFNETGWLRPIFKFMTLRSGWEKLISQHFEEQVKDPELAKKLRPDYPIGCKRVVISDDYYPALQQPNVALETNGIERLTESGIRTTDGREHEFDVIIYGTGFLSTEFLSPLEIKGLQGRDLNEAWKDGAEAYLGITMPGFPNFYMLYGPNTNLGHNSIIFMIESQVNYVMSAIRTMMANRARYLNLRPEVMARFNERMKARLSSSVWEAGCNSWYKTETGKVVNNWPDFTFRYRRATKFMDPGDYMFYPPANAGGAQAAE